jgi:hypothetical protein
MEVHGVNHVSRDCATMRGMRTASMIGALVLGVQVSTVGCGGSDGTGDSGTARGTDAFVVPPGTDAYVAPAADANVDAFFVPVDPTSGPRPATPRARARSPKRHSRPT